MAAKKQMHITTTEKRRVCLADWDGTLRRGYTLQDWLPFLIKKLQVGSEHGRALDAVFSSYDRRTITYEQLVDQAAEVHAKALNGQSVADVEQAAAEFALQDTKLFASTAVLLNHLRASGIDVIILSGAPREVICAYSKFLGFSDVFALQMRIGSASTYIAEIQFNCGTSAEKQAISHSIAKNANVVFALGNSISDRPLFAAATRGIFVVEDVNAVDTLRRHPSLSSLAIEYLTPEQMMGNKLLLESLGWNS